MKLGKALWAVALAAPFVWGGCVVEIEPDPFGPEVSVEGAWLINGAAPSAASCDAVGITDVRVRVLDGAGSWIDRSLTFPCAQGSFSTSPVLLAGDYDLVVEAVNRSGGADVLVAAADPMAFRASFGDTIVLGTVDFVVDSVPAGTLQGSWTINGATPDAGNCAGLGIAEVHVQFLDGAGVPDPASTLAYACATGGFSELLVPGSYEIRVVAVDADGVIIATAMNQMFTLADGDTFIINGGAPVDFVGGFNPLGNDAVLNATWSIGGQMSTDKSCDAVAGTSVELWFYAPDDTELTSGVRVVMGAPCGDGVFNSGTPLLAAGDYLVAAQLLATGGAVISEVQTASPVTVGAGTPLDLDLDFRLDSSTVVAFFEWESRTAAGTYTDCATAGVDAMRWELYFDDGSAGGAFVAGQDPGMTVACGEEINVMSGVGGAALAPGDYDVVIEGYRGGFKSWDPVGICSLTIDAAGGLGLSTCRADYNP